MSVNRIATRRIYISVVRFLALLVCGFALGAERDPLEIVRRAVEVHNRNWEIVRDYTFHERVEKIDRNGEGELKEREVKKYAVSLLEGSIYRRLIAVDDEPLPPEDAEAQWEIYEHHREERRNEKPKEREKRIRKFNEDREEYTEAIEEVPEAFEFHLKGEDEVNGYPVYVITFNPRPGYRPEKWRAKLFTQLAGTLWIHKTDYYLVRAKAKLMDTVTFGWILFRLGEGSEVELEQVRVNDEAWHLSRLWFGASARIGLIKQINIEEEHRYTQIARPEDAEVSRR